MINQYLILLFLLSLSSLHSTNAQGVEEQPTETATSDPKSSSEESNEGIDLGSSEEANSTDPHNTGNRPHHHQFGGRGEENGPHRGNRNGSGAERGPMGGLLGQNGRPRGGWGAPPTVDNEQNPNQPDFGQEERDRLKREINPQDGPELYNLTKASEESLMVLLGSLNGTQKREIWRIVSDSSQSTAQLEAATDAWAGQQGGEVEANYETYKQSLEAILSEVEQIHDEIAQNLSAEARAVDQQLMAILTNDNLNTAQQCQQVGPVLANATREVKHELKSAFGPLPCTPAHRGGHRSHSIHHGMRGGGGGRFGGGSALPSRGGSGGGGGRNGNQDVDDVFGQEGGPARGGNRGVPFGGGQGPSNSQIFGGRNPPQFRRASTNNQNAFESQEQAQQEQLGNGQRGRGLGGGSRRGGQQQQGGGGGQRGGGLSFVGGQQGGGRGIGQNGGWEQGGGAGQGSPVEEGFAAQRGGRVWGN